MLSNFFKLLPRKINKTEHIFHCLPSSCLVYFQVHPNLRFFGSTTNNPLKDIKKPLASSSKKKTTKKVEKKPQVESADEIAKSSENKDEIPSETNQEKEREKNFDKCYSFVLIRVINTCNGYLKEESLEQRKNMTEESRFWYIKQELDSLSPEEKQSFLACIDQYSVIRDVEESNDASVQTKKPKRSNHLNYSKNKVREFFVKNKGHAAILARLIPNFLNPENKDFKFYLDPANDEISIGNTTSRSKSMHQDTRELFKNEFLELKLGYKRLFYDLGLLQLKLPKSSGPEIPEMILRALQIPNGAAYAKDRKNLFAFTIKTKSLLKQFYSETKYKQIIGHIFKRVSRTCKIYLSSSEKERMSIDEKSRFSYVHNRLKFLTDSEKEDFWAYLDHFTEITHTSSVSSIIKFLKHSDFGIILSKLILEFSEKDNPDYLVYLNPFEDEVAIKTFEKRTVFQLNQDSVEILKVDLEYLNFTFCDIFRKNLV